MAQNHLVGHLGVIFGEHLYDRYYVTNGVQIDMQTSMVVNIGNTCHYSHPKIEISGSCPHLPREETINTD